MDEKWNKFMSYVQVDEESGCWLWQGTLDRDGYGHYKEGNKFWQAHRYSYTHLCGEVPPSLVLDHKVCQNRRCVNPAHLEPITNRENILRGNGRGAINARKTHCWRGHPFDAKNTYHYKGTRTCRKCNVIRTMESQARKKAGGQHA